MADLKEDIIKFYTKSSDKKDFDISSFFKIVNKQYRQIDCVGLYNHILNSENKIEFLDITIRQINKTKYFDNLNSLIDFTLNSIPISERTNVIVLAIKTIGNYKNSSALNILLEILNHKNINYKIRLATIEALGKIGDKNAFDLLQKVAVDENEKSTYIKESAVVALGLLGDSRALDVYNSIINTKQLFQEKFAFLKERIIEAISKFDISKNEKALKILKNSLYDNNPKVRIASIETIMNSGMLSSYELIYDRLKFDDDIEVKKNALIALYNISDNKILDEILNNDYCSELKKLAKEIYNNEEN